MLRLALYRLSAFPLRTPSNDFDGVGGRRTGISSSDPSIDLLRLALDRIGGVTALGTPVAPSLTDLDGAEGIGTSTLSDRARDML